MPEEDFNAFLPRILRIILSIILSVGIANVLALSFWSDPVPPDIFAFGPNLLWFTLRLFLFWPAYVAGLAFIAVDRLAFRFAGLKQWLLLWPVGAATGVVLAGMYRPELGVYFLFLLVYWLLTGRVAGRRGWSPKNLRGSDWDERLYPFVVGALLAIALVTSFTPVLEPPSGRRVEISANELGTPPIQFQYEWQKTEAMADALRRFPDPQSCLQDGAEANRHDDLIHIDWERIQTPEQAQVCIFRLVTTFGDVSLADTWLKAQGFSVSDQLRSSLPSSNIDGSLRVVGYWSIRDQGRLFAKQAIRPVPSWQPYGMGVHLIYSTDGRDLIFVDIGFSFL